MDRESPLLATMTRNNKVVATAGWVEVAIVTAVLRGDIMAGATITARGASGWQKKKTTEEAATATSIVGIAGAIGGVRRGHRRHCLQLLPLTTTTTV